MNKPGIGPFDRRDFLKVAAGGVGALMAGSANAQTESLAAKPAVDAPVSGPASLTPVRPGADFMIDVIKQLGFEYVSVNPGANFTGLMESAVNYGGEKKTQPINPPHREKTGPNGHRDF